MENQITTFFEEKIAACQAAVTALREDNRADEAVFEKIRMNVFNIFATVYKAGGSVSGGDSRRQLEFLRNQLEKITGDWQSAAETFRKHGDCNKVHIEQTKLAVAEEIRQKLTEWSDDK